MPQELINGIFIKGNPLAPHLGVLIPNSFLCGPCISVEFHDYFRVIFSHGPCELSSLPPGNFLWNSVYSSSLSWTRLSLRKDQLLIASKRCWCSSLRNRCSSNSMSACGAALDPSLAMSFLDLLERSFFGAIACKDTSIKS